MGMMITDTKLPLDYRSHPFGSPYFPPEPVGFCSPGQETGDPGQFLSGELGLGTRGGMVSQGLDATLPGTLHPLAYGTWAYTQSICDVHLFPPFLTQFPGTKPSALAPTSWLG